MSGIINVLLGTASSAAATGIVPSWSTNTTNTSILTGARSVSFDVHSDGTTLRNNQSGSTITAGPNWFNPTTTGIGSSYWVFATYTTTTASGGTMTDSGSFNSWIQLSGGTSWGWSTVSGASGTEWAGTMTLQFAASAGGTVLGTGSVGFDVGYTP